MIEVDRRLSGPRGTKTLDRILGGTAAPCSITVDHSIAPGPDGRRIAHRGNRGRRAQHANTGNPLQERDRELRVGSVDWRDVEDGLVHAPPCSAGDAGDRWR